ncbi:hypothetical protein [Sporomusa acidovorans]|uniref:Small, acid-soluble spore protein gamma-type n=1 Tax=Sporomusa acidovorans (strain ATCC 49682 / DSM 3132 / Mol) TaxID=1123286 RepID=A0ABZ3JAK1_SPOA4|nr:hypothetical protein [Sporomusa acidovorans]OZC13277.1 hypothetical protein SPACI_57720 [Sporomusa acidovorans DSM 3132]SDD98367.1 hypothetical protein SAMN04488499_100678 [Sporomusa acidovorans]
MGFKDLPGGAAARQGQSAADKITAQQNSNASNTLSKQNSLTSAQSPK